MKCPRCGKPTDGAWSEGGLKWAICGKCMQADRKREDREFRLALADNPYAPAPWRTHEYIMREAGIIN